MLSGSGVEPFKATITIFVSFSGQGGVERMITHLARGFLSEGFHVDFVLARDRGDHVKSIPEGVNLIKLGTSHTSTALPGLIKYFRRNRPLAVLAVKDRAIKVATLARYLSRSKTRLVGRVGTTVSAALEDRGWFRKRIWYSGMRSFYRRTDGIIAVSQGVAEDIRSITGLTFPDVHVVPNPVISDEIRIASREKVNHYWFRQSEIPVILSVGRLTKQKDFSTLIRAFAGMRTRKECRLVILGEGRQREKLKDLILSLDLGDAVIMPGFVPNPYAWISKCSLFVLSSLWEGSPNALTEALALGIPVVSTDCRSGPREILQDGKYGRLVAVGDWKSLAEAMLTTLEQPLPPDFLKEASSEYTVTASSRKYIEILTGD